MSSSGNAATFTITDTNLYVPTVTLKIEDNTKLSKLLSKGFKRSIYWNKYKIIFKNYNDNEYIRERLDASFQGFNKLFVLAYATSDNVTNENSYKKYFLPRLKIKNYDIEIDSRNFYDQSINDSVKQYDEIIFTRKTDNTIRVYYILEQSKETTLKFLKRATKFL